MITKLKQQLENFKRLNLFRCPKCLAQIYEEALEQVNVIDYFEELYLYY